MRVKSLWQPYASLLVGGHKLIETSAYAAPSTILRQRLGIASTKIIKPEQRALFDDPVFCEYYEKTGLPPLDELPHGALVGAVTIHTSDIITDEDIEDITEEERLYGWWVPGRFAWRCRDAQALDKPIPCRGAQGIWIWPENEESNVIQFSRAV